MPQRRKRFIRKLGCSHDSMKKYGKWNVQIDEKNKSHANLQFLMRHFVSNFKKSCRPIPVT